MLREQITVLHRRLLAIVLRAEKSLAGLTTLALHGRIEVFDQCLSVERLTQEAGCSGFQCLRE